MSIFSERLKYIRNLRGLSQTELGEILGVQKNAVSQWETDKRFPLEDTLMRIVDYFDVSLDYLMGRTDDMKGKVVETVIQGHQMKLTFDKDVYKEKYSNGLSAEDLLEIMKLLDKSGFKVVPKE